VRTLTGAELRDEYARPERPVIFTGLFDGQPIAEIGTEAEVRRRLGGMRLKTRPSYVAGLMGGAPAEPGETREESLDEYLDYVAEHPATRRCCVELTTPGELRSLFSVPAPCRELEALPDDVLSLLFVANRGNSAHLHFDCDHRQVLLHQVMGVKRVILISPRAGRKVMPFGSLSALLLEEMPDEEKGRLAAYLGAYDTLLHPGETLFMPALAWHYVEYVDTGMSFSVRFGRGALDRLVAEGVFHDMHVQNVGSALATGRAGGDVERGIREALAREYGSPAEQYLSLKRHFAGLCRELCPETFDARFSLAPLAPMEERLGVRFYASRTHVEGGAADGWRR
jgi:lysine-specific demethylase 8